MEVFMVDTKAFVAMVSDYVCELVRAAFFRIFSFTAQR